MEKKATTGCLLVHGFGGIPQEMRPLGKFLEGHGCEVKHVQLAGHGRDVHSAGKITWGDWLHSLEAGYKKLAEEVEEIFLLGHSTGGLLALLLSARYPVRGVVGYAPIIQFNFWQRAAFWASRRINRLPPTLGFYSPDGESLRIHLTQVPPTAVAALKDLIDGAPGELPKINLPVLLFYGGLDLSVSAGSGVRLQALLSNARVEKVVLPWADHLLMFPRHRKSVWGRTLSFIQAYSKFSTFWND
jgi:carboxylesterase